MNTKECVHLKWYSVTLMCEEQIARKDLEQHNSDKVIQHLQVMVTKTKEEASRGIKTTIKKFDYDILVSAISIEDSEAMLSMQMICFIATTILMAVAICGVIIVNNIDELKLMQKNSSQYQLRTLQRLYWQLSGKIDGVSDFIQTSIKEEILHKPLQVPDSKFDLPAVVLMPDIFLKIINKESWKSEPFFAFAGGYQMCLQVYVTKQDLSVYLNLMKGPHDDELQESGHWPVRGTFVIELLNSISNTNHMHYRRTIEVSENACGKCAIRVLNGNYADVSAGLPHYMSLDRHFTSSSLNYGRVNFLYFRISYEDIPAVPYFSIAPVNFRLFNCTDRMKVKAPWYSDHFLAFTEGYTMRLKVHVGGIGNGAGTHVSIYLFLMRGPYDDKLQRLGRWPLRGVFTIKLLNQCGYTDHSTQMMITFNEESCNKCTCMH